MERRRIVLTGGGTLGPVTPLLAVVEVARAQNLPFDFYWIGTSDGPERDLVEAHDISFFAISGGKLSRFVDWKIVLVPWQVLRGFYQARKIFRKLEPHVMVSAGAYISVPAAYAAKSLGIPAVVHEMDVARGLANKLMQPVASVRTAIWPRQGAQCIGNLVRPLVARTTPQEARVRLDIPLDADVVLITGGGTGAMALNKLTWAVLPLLPRGLWVLHLTGQGKKDDAIIHEHYIQVEYVGESMRDFLAAANVVVTRGGVGTLSELAVLKKPAVVIPMPRTHQEANANYLKEHDAAYVLDQRDLQPKDLAAFLQEIFSHLPEAEKKASALHELIPDGTSTFVEILEKV